MMYMGGFCQSPGVREIHMEYRDFGGLPFSRLEERRVVIHSEAFSPNNAQILLEEGFPCHWFFSAARYVPNPAHPPSFFDPQRAVAAFHLIPGNSEVEAAISTLLEISGNVKELLEALSGMDDTLGPAVKMIGDLIYKSIGL